MQFRIFSGFLIFIGSYFPLGIILAIQDIPNNWWTRPLCSKAILTIENCDFIPFSNPIMVFVFIFMTGLAVLVARASLQRISFPFDIEIKQVKAIPNEIINYTFPYVVSFMGINFGEPQKFLGFFVFLIWMFAITYKSRQILMNPLLIIFDWHLYEASILINGTLRDVRILNKGQLILGKQKAQTIQDFYIIRN